MGFGSKEIKERIVQSTMEIHGVEYYGQSDEFKQRIREIWKSKNKDELNSILEKTRSTCHDHLGVDYPTQSNDVKRKVQKTNFLKWGKWYCQTDEFAKKCHKRYTNPKYPDMTFATSWEFKVYDFLTENHIEFEYQPNISIPYYCEGTRHYYHPDFLVGDRIVEVKGDHFFRINEETGEEEMYLTWQGNLSDEEYELKCELYEAKHQCMLSNNVIILRGKDIDNLSVEMFSSSVS